jgi:hypothetical protein
MLEFEGRHWFILGTAIPVAYLTSFGGGFFLYESSICFSIVTLGGACITVMLIALKPCKTR